MSPYRRNVVVGFVVLCSLGVLAWMSLQFANQAATFFLTKGTTIFMVADRADGLSDGSGVQYLGVNVGRVERIVLLEDGSGVRIELIIDADKVVPQNVKGSIRSG